MGGAVRGHLHPALWRQPPWLLYHFQPYRPALGERPVPCALPRSAIADGPGAVDDFLRSEEHTSELQSLMRISYAVFCLKKKNTHNTGGLREQLSTTLKSSHSSSDSDQVQVSASVELQS